MGACYPGAALPACGILQVSDTQRFARRRPLPRWLTDRLTAPTNHYLGAADADQPGGLELATDWSVGSLPFHRSPRSAKVPPRMDLGRRGLRMPCELDAETFAFSEPSWKFAWNRIAVGPRSPSAMWIENQCWMGPARRSRRMRFRGEYASRSTIMARPAIPSA